MGRVGGGCQLGDAAAWAPSVPEAVNATPRVRFAPAALRVMGTRGGSQASPVRTPQATLGGRALTVVFDRALTRVGDGQPGVAVFEPHHRLPVCSRRASGKGVAGASQAFSQSPDAQRR